MDVFWGLMIILVALFIYFLPSIIAGTSHKNFSAIFLLNFLLGWTFLGWVVSIVWAVKK